MGVVQKQGIQNAIISYAGALLGAVNAILLIPNFLAPDQVGLSSILVHVSMFYFQISAVGTFYITMKYFPEYKKVERAHNGFPILLMLIALIGFAITSLAFFVFRQPIEGLFVDNSPLFVEYFYFVVPLAFFGLYFNLFMALSRSYLKTVFPSFLRDVLIRLMITLSILLYAIKLISFHQFIILFVVVNCSLTIILLAYIMYIKALIFTTRISISFKQTFEFVKYGLFTLLGGVSEFIYKNIDVIMIGSMVSLAGVGIYSRAVYLTAMLAIPARSFYKITYPKIAEFQQSGNMEQIKSFYKKVSLTNLIIGGILFLNVYLNIDFIFGLMPLEYAAGIITFLFLAAGKLFDITTGINFQIVLTSKYYKYDTFFNVLLLILVIGLNVSLIPHYGINGAAAATMLTFLIVNVLRLAMVWWKFKIQPFEISTLYVLVICAITYLITSFLPVPDNIFLALIVRSSVCSTLILGSIYYFNISPDISAFVNKLLARILR